MKKEKIEMKYSPSFILRLLGRISSCWQLYYITRNTYGDMVIYSLCPPVQINQSIHCCQLTSRINTIHGSIFNQHFSNSISHNYQKIWFVEIYFKNLSITFMVLTSVSYHYLESINHSIKYLFISHVSLMLLLYLSIVYLLQSFTFCVTLIVFLPWHSP